MATIEETTFIHNSVEELMGQDNLQLLDLILEYVAWSVPRFDDDIILSWLVATLPCKYSLPNRYFLYLRYDRHLYDTRPEEEAAGLLKGLK